MGWLADGVALTAESCTRDTATLEGVRDRAGHGFFMKDEKLYIHAGYDSQHNVLHDLVEVDVSSGTSRNHARAHTHAQPHHCSPWQSDGFSTRTMEYKSVLPNLERRWHCNFLHDDRYFVHGGTPSLCHSPGSYALYSDRSAVHCHHHRMERQRRPGRFDLPRPQYVQSESHHVLSVEVLTTLGMFLQIRKNGPRPSSRGRCRPSADGTR